MFSEQFEKVIRLNFWKISVIIDLAACKLPSRARVIFKFLRKIIARVVF